MRKILILILLSVAFICNSCQDNLEDEQFQKFVLLVKNGYKEYQVELKESETIRLPVSVGLNGTTKNNEDVRVRIGIASDTLNGYNFDKYKDETTFYHAVFPSSNYSLTPGDSTIVIKAGQEYAAFDLELKDLENLPDKYKEYILPLSIKETSMYSIAQPKYSTLLMRLIFSNSFSGVYKSSGKVKEVGGGEVDGPSRTLYAISHNECYTYAGNIDYQDPDRKKYIIHIKIEDGNKVSMSALDPSIEFVKESASVEITKEDDLSDKRKVTVNTIIKVKYRYKDLHNEGFPVEMIADNITLSNTRSIDK